MAAQYLPPEAPATPVRPNRDAKTLRVQVELIRRAFSEKVGVVSERGKGEEDADADYLTGLGHARLLFLRASNACSALFDER